MPNVTLTQDISIFDVTVEMENMEHSQVTDSIFRASAELQKEYELVDKELQSFDEFRKRIIEVDIPEPKSDGGTRLRVPIQSPPQARRPKQGDRICRAYRETVMSVSHFEEEYDDSLRKHMVAEFGPDLVNSLFNCHQLTPQAKRGLLEASQQSSDQRAKFLKILDSESEDLKYAQSTLDGIIGDLVEWNERPFSAYSFSQLQEFYECLTDFERRCEQLAVERQQNIHADVWPSLDGSVRNSLQCYLYYELDITYPILTDIADCCTLLQEVSRSVEKSISTTD